MRETTIELAVDLDGRPGGQRSPRHLDELVRSAGDEEDGHGSLHSVGTGLAGLGVVSACACSRAGLTRCGRAELLFTGGERSLALLHCLALELDGSELASPAIELGLLGGQTGFALHELAAELLELDLALGQVLRAQSEQSLDRGPHVAKQRFTPLEVAHDLLEAACLLLQLAAPGGEELLELLLRARRMGKHATCQVRVGRILGFRVIFVSASPWNEHAHSVSHQRASVWVPADPSCCRRRRNGPPACGEFAGSCGTPALGENEGQETVRKSRYRRDGHARRTAAGGPAPRRSLDGHARRARRGGRRLASVRWRPRSGRGHQ